MSHPVPRICSLGHHIMSENEVACQVSSACIFFSHKTIECRRQISKENLTIFLVLWSTPFLHKRWYFAETKSSAHTSFFPSYNVLKPDRGFYTLGVTFRWNISGKKFLGGKWFSSAKPLSDAARSKGPWRKEDTIAQRSETMIGSLMTCKPRNISRSWTIMCFRRKLTTNLHPFDKLSHWHL